MVSQTIAIQRGPSLFVSMLAYQTIVYAFLFDTFMFDFTVTGFQLVCLVAILAVLVFQAIYKYRIS